MPMLNANRAIVFRNFRLVFLPVMLAVLTVELMRMRKNNYLPGNKR